VAVQTNNLAVGASVPYAQAGVGAVVSQFETNPHYGPQGLSLMSQGKNPSQVLQLLLQEDGNFEGQGPEARQVAIVSIDEGVAIHSGDEVLRAKWAGSRFGIGYSVQGNGLAGPQVLEAMERGFVNTSGSLAERLMTALTAGDAAGGQDTGRESAALLVKTPDGWPVDIDLRVDHSADPVADLRALLNMQLARQQIVQARRAAKRGNLEEAQSLLIAAVARASSWQRIWLMGAEVAADIEEPQLALQYLNVVFAQNQGWRKTTIGDGDYFALGGDPLFHRWVSSEQRQEAMKALNKLDDSKGAPGRLQIDVAKKLLEAGYPGETLSLLSRIGQKSESMAQVHSLMAEAYAAQRNFSKAIEECRFALAAEPGNLRLHVKLAHFQAASETLTTAPK
jgi:uncharacterized Ntn-hydrolase superfamily protein